MLGVVLNAAVLGTRPITTSFFVKVATFPQHSANIVSFKDPKLQIQMDPYFNILQILLTSKLCSPETNGGCHHITKSSHLYFHAVNEDRQMGNFN